MPDAAAAPQTLAAAPVAAQILPATSPGMSPPQVRPAVPSPAEKTGAAVDDKLDDLSRRVTLLTDQLRNQGLLNMHNQLMSLKSEIARLRGTQEEMGHAQQMAEKRQKELFADLDSRLKELAKRPVAPPPEPVRPQAVQAPAAPAAPTAPVEVEGETRAYESALNHFKSADYVAAVSAFNAYVVKFPHSALASNALYWLGLAYYALADYKSAVEAQKRLIKDHPESAKVPDASLSLARAQIQLGENEPARQTLDQLVAKHPTTKAADNARKLLALFK